MPVHEGYTLVYITLPYITLAYNARCDQCARRKARLPSSPSTESGTAAGGRARFGSGFGTGGTGLIVYDNHLGQDEYGDAATALGGGSIVIHKG